MILLKYILFVVIIITGVAMCVVVATNRDSSLLEQGYSCNRPLLGPSNHRAPKQRTYGKKGQYYVC